MLRKLDVFLVMFAGMLISDGIEWAVESFTVVLTSRVADSLWLALLSSN